MDYNNICRCFYKEAIKLCSPWSLLLRLQQSRKWEISRHRSAATLISGSQEGHLSVPALGRLHGWHFTGLGDTQALASVAYAYTSISFTRGHTWSTGGSTCTLDLHVYPCGIHHPVPAGHFCLSSPNGKDMHALLMLVNMIASTTCKKKKNDQKF